MDSLELWRLETISFLLELERKVETLGKSTDKDKKIMFYLFCQYIKYSQEHDMQKCMIIHEFIDKYSCYGLRYLKREIKASILTFKPAAA